MSEESPPEKRVYFLGAGASNDEFGLPTMRSFFRLEDFCKEEYPQLEAFIKKNFPKIPFPEVNLEDVITYLELSLDRFGSFGKRPNGKVSDAREQFDRLVQERLELREEKRLPSKNNLKSIFEDLEVQDSIISLNYDVVVEKRLGQVSGGSNNIRVDQSFYLLQNAVNTKYKNLRRNLSDGLFLKLHGSLDWFQCPDSGCPDYSRISIRENTNEPMVCLVCGSDLQIAIVPPTMNKSFERWPKLGLIWRLAREELTAAAKVVFIGVSFAPSDYYLRWLIKSSFLNPKSNKDSVVVVDKCSSVRKKIKEMVDIEPTYYPSIKKYMKKELDKK